MESGDISKGISSNFLIINPIGNKSAISEIYPPKIILYRVLFTLIL